MNKTLKEKIIKKHEENKEAFPNLYDQRWVEKAATDGWNRLVKGMEKMAPELAKYAREKEGYNIFAVIYYTSFENALNTFFMQCMDDSIANVQLILDEFQKVSAEIREKIGKQ